MRIASLRQVRNYLAYGDFAEANFSGVVENMRAEKKRKELEEKEE